MTRMRRWLPGDGLGWLLLIFGAISLGNAVWMLADPLRWYHELPAEVPDFGPFNPHFVRDIGCAFATVGGGAGVGGAGAAGGASRWSPWQVSSTSRTRSCTSSTRCARRSSRSTGCSTFPVSICRRSC